jgi:hypothetical protein
VRRQFTEGLSITRKQTVEQQPPARVSQGFEDVVAGETRVSDKGVGWSRLAVQHRHVTHWSLSYADAAVEIRAMRRNALQPKPEPADC